MTDTRRYPPIEVYLTVRGGAEAIAFYERAFDAKETFLQMAEDGKRVLHADLDVFGCRIMLCDEFPEHAADVAAPPSVGGASVTVQVNLDTPDKVNAVMDKAAAAGCEMTMRPVDAFWGARYGRLRDPFGHVWSFAAPLNQPT